MIEIINVHKSFGSKYVLRGIDLTINKGESLTIIGGSGCGKSVLLKHMVGLLSPDKGDVKIDEISITNLPKKDLFKIQKKFGVLFQGAALFDSLTVYENVSFGIRNLTDYNEDKIRNLVDEKLAVVGLAGIGNLKPAELSGGMKKRVGLARAIAYEPEYILYDEPTTGLDPIMADVINDLIIDLKQKLQITSIVVTHDMASAYKISDRIAMTHEGKIIEVGTPDQIKNTKNAMVKQFITGSSKGPITIGNNLHKDDI